MKILNLSLVAFLCHTWDQFYIFTCDIFQYLLPGMVEYFSQCHNAHISNNFGKNAMKHYHQSCISEYWTKLNIEWNRTFSFVHFSVLIFSLKVNIVLRYWILKKQLKIFCQSSTKAKLLHQWQWEQRQYCRDNTASSDNWWEWQIPCFHRISKNIAKKPQKVVIFA